MSQSQITCSVGPDGTVTILDVKPAPGKNCRDLTAELETRLGVVDESTRESTANAYVKNDPLHVNVESN